MQKSELLTTILNDYAVEHKSSDAEKASAAPDVGQAQTDVQIGGTSTKLAVNAPQIVNTSFQITGR